MTACPISSDQLPYARRFTRGNGSQSGAPNMPGIPTATDLPSLIRTTNVIRDVLRQLTTSLTVNNVWIPRPPFFKAQGDTYYSQYPQWDQKSCDVSVGFVYHHTSAGIDTNHRAHISRVDRINYENRMQDDPIFTWSYIKPLDALGVEPLF